MQNRLFFDCFSHLPLDLKQRLFSLMDSASFNKLLLLSKKLRRGFKEDIELYRSLSEETKFISYFEKCVESGDLHLFRIFKQAFADKLAPISIKEIINKDNKYIETINNYFESEKLGTSLIYKAIKGNQLEIFQYLLENDANYSENCFIKIDNEYIEESPIAFAAHRAVELADFGINNQAILDIIKLLVKKGIDDPNAVNTQQEDCDFAAAQTIVNVIVKEVHEEELNSFRSKINFLEMENERLRAQLKRKLSEIAEENIECKKYRLDRQNK